MFEGVASLPGEDLQGEETLPQGLEIDYLLGKGLPPGAGGYINYDHQDETIVGVPLDGKITSKGFWIKWKALKTPFMQKIVDQMKAMKEAGWPRRYGMSIEGVVKERDPNDPTRIIRAFIRNVALTPTPVHPGTFVDFAKSLSASSTVEYRPEDLRYAAIKTWARTAAQIATGDVVVKSNPYFHSNGLFRLDADVPYFQEVQGLPEKQALWCARFALSRQHALRKSLNRSRGHPNDPVETIRLHLLAWKKSHPDCPHVDATGHIQGGVREAARHFLICEHRRRSEVEAILHLLENQGGESV